MNTPLMAGALHRLVAAAVGVLLASSSPAFAQLSGVRSIGPTGNYPTISAAIADIQAQGLNGALTLELQPAYTGAAETFPLVIPKLNGASLTNAVTLRPQTGAIDLAITSNNADATVILDGAMHVVIDGRPGGVGTAKQLTIENTNAAGAAIRLHNEASSNTIRHAILRGVNTSTTGGVVIFGATTGANGNDINTIDSCDIRDGATTPNNAVFSAGATGTAAQFNTGNAISNCNIFNFHPAVSGDTAGVRLNGGNTDWTISGNSFFQTTSRIGNASTTRAVFVNTTAGNNFTISGNFIGGSAPSAGGTPWTISGTAAAHRFVGIQLNAGITTASKVNGNTIGNLAWLSTSAAVTLPGVWTGIYVQAGAANVGATSGNTIGGSGQPVTVSAPGGVNGIGIANNGAHTVANNSVSALSVTSAATTALVRGIFASGGVNTIAGNTISDLSSAAGSTGSATAASIIGISQESIQANQSITGNTVHSLSNTHSSAAVQVLGIVNRAVASVVNRNFVHSLKALSSSTGVRLSGITASIGGGLYANNMVRLGIDSTGATVAGNYDIRGIEDLNDDNRYSHNSVFIGGSGVSGASGATHAFISRFTGSVSLANNAFVNARSNSSGDIRHYAVTILSPSTPALTSNHNIFFASGTGGVLGSFDGFDQNTLAAWQNTTGQDFASASVDPLFVNPAAAFPDLHLQPTNPAERGGSADPAVTDDFDGETRSTLTPTDIGADAGAFNSSGDVFLPQISYTPLADGSPANRTLTNFATITDNIGVAGGANLPRLYFKRSTDADVFGGNTAADNGWKFVTASNSSSPYSFTIDYALLPSGKAAIGNTIEYFVVAQDEANNLASLPRGATASAAPPVQNISGKSATVNSYKIVGTLSGTFTVCAVGCDYISLTGADGFFAAVNGSTVSGDVTAKIAGDLQENGLNKLNQWTESGGGNYTLRIEPADGTMKTIAGNVASPLGMIHLDGADRVTIDGRFNNAGRFLTFRNLNTTNGTTLSLDGDASGNTIRNCVIEGAGTGGAGVVYFIQGVTTGNDNNLITHNVVRDRSDAPGVPRALIYADAALASRANSNNTISHNELFNFTHHAIDIPASGNESWTISENTIYQTAPRTLPLHGIACSSSGTTVLSGNTIKDLNTSAAATGILLRPESGSVTVSRNRVHGSAGGTFFGVLFEGRNDAKLTLSNNQLALVPSVIADQDIIGFYDGGSSTTTVTASFNSVFIGGTASGTKSTWAFLRDGGSTHTARNNIWFNGRTGGAGDHFAAGDESGSGTFSSDHNVFVGTGATAGSFFDFGAAPVSFGTWQANTGGDANSHAGNPGSGHFTSAMFVNPAIGDLHIAPTGNPLVSNTGTPVAGVAVDYDGETRDAATPDIGSDEFIAAPDIAVQQPIGVSLGSGVSSVDFGVVAPGGDNSRTFTVTNAGSAELNGIAVSFDTGNAADFSLTAGPAASLQPGESTMFTVKFAPAAAGDRSTLLRIASNDADENPFTVTLTGKRLTQQEAWRVQHFGSAANSGDGADGNDFDGDGMSNKLEFVTGSHPRQSSGAAATLVLGEGTLEFSYRRALAAVEQGFRFEVQFADDLSAPIWSGVADEFVSSDGTIELRKAVVPRGSNGRRFLRLQILDPL